MMMRAVSRSLRKAQYNESYRDRVLFSIQSCLGSTIFYLTTGAFMSGFAGLLGAKEKDIGLLEVCSKVAGIVQIFSPMLFSKRAGKKFPVTLLMGIYKLLICSVVLIPILIPFKSFQPGVLILTVFMAYFFMHLAWPGFMCWIMNAVPEKVRGSYFSIRYANALVLSTVFSIIMGFVVDYFKAVSPYTGFAIVFGGSFILAAVDIFVHFLIRDTAVEERRETLNLKDCITIPLKEKGYIKVVFLFILWNIAINMGTPFLSIFQIKYLQVDYKYIMFFNLLMNLSTIISVRFWGRYADKFSWSHSMLLSIGVYSISQFLWIIAGRGSLFLLPVIFAISGVAWGGLTNSIQNLPFEYAPKENKTVYIGFNYVVGGISGLLANLAAGRVINSIGDQKVGFLLFHVYGIQIVVFISAMVMAVSVLYGAIALIGVQNRRKAVAAND